MDIFGLVNQLLDHFGAYNDDFQYPNRGNGEEEDEFEEDEDEYPPPNLTGKFNLVPHPYYDGVKGVEESLTALQKLIKADKIEEVRKKLDGKEYKPGKADYAADPFETTITRHEFSDEEYVKMNDYEVACFFGSPKCFKYLIEKCPNKQKYILDKRCGEFALFSQNTEIISTLKEMGEDFKYNAKKVLKGIRHSGRKISAELFQWLLEDVKIEITMSDVLRFNDRDLFMIAYKHGVPVDKHTVAFAAKCGLFDYVKEIANSENVNQETTRQHDAILKHPEIMAGGETALFFAAEKKDFEFYKYLIDLGASPVHYLETNGLIPLVYAFNDVDFGMKVLELTQLDDYLFEHLLSEALIYNNIEMLVRVCEYSKFRPSKRVRGMACLARTKEAAEVIMNHPDVFEVAPADIDIIEKKKKHRKDVLGLFKPNGGPSASYFKKDRFEIDGPLGKPTSPGEDRKVVLSIMMGNVEQALPILQKRGKPVLSDGKSLFNSRFFSFEPRSFIPTLELEPEMNPTNQFTPILLASFIDHRVNMWNIGLSLYHRGADPTIEFDNNNVLGNLYRSICKYNSHMDILKLLWLTRQKIYEKTRGEKEREMEEPDENIYDDFF